jgi:hypothetical protein
MTEMFCFPSLESLKHAWKHQKEKQTVYFRCLGMNDSALLYTKQMIEEDDYGKIQVLDFSYNSLTNASAHLLYSMTQAYKERTITIILVGNCFDLASIKKDEVKLFLLESTRHLPPVQIKSSLDLSIINMEDSNHNARLIETEKNIHDISTELKIVVSAIAKLTTETTKLKETTDQHTKLFDKHHKSIERKLANHVCEKYNYSPVNTEEIKLLGTLGYNNETDVFLISQDGTKVLIGEAKNEMKTYAFTQVETRKEKFTNIPREQLPARLSKYTKVILLVGANISEERFHAMALCGGYLFGKPNNDTYVVEDTDNQL